MLDQAQHARSATCKADFCWLTILDANVGKPYTSMDHAPSCDSTPPKSLLYKSKSLGASFLLRNDDSFRLRLGWYGSRRAFTGTRLFPCMFLLIILSIGQISLRADAQDCLPGRKCVQLAFRWQQPKVIRMD